MRKEKNGQNRLLVFIIVDLPAPFAPMTETISPG
jgi:hypothetical protein